MRAYIDHKRPIRAIKSFALSFFSQSDSFPDLFYAVLLSWNSSVYYKWQQVILYIDRMDWGAGHLSIIVGTGGRAFANKNCPQGRALEQFFQMPGVCPGVCPGGGCSRLESTRTLYKINSRGCPSGTVVRPLAWPTIKVYAVPVSVYFKTIMRRHESGFGKAFFRVTIVR